MKRNQILFGAVLPALLACGCSSMSNTEGGALGGGLLGAGAGALIGHATGHTGAGAFIGAGAGALTGGLIGHAVDKSEERTAAQVAAAGAEQQRQQLGMIDVVQLAQTHVADEVIIAQIRSTGSVFHLSSNDTIYLKQQGVSDAVVQEMLLTANRYPRRVYTSTPVYTERVYVVDPDPPPVAVGVGFGYTHYGRWR
jgi:outer membrane lipoprotein SlyB